MHANYITNTEDMLQVKVTCQDCCWSRIFMLLRQRIFSTTALLDASGSGCSKSPSSVPRLPSLLDFAKDKSEELLFTLDFWVRYSSKYAPTRLKMVTGVLTCKLLKALLMCLTWETNSPLMRFVMKFVRIHIQSNVKSKTESEWTSFV